MMAKRVQVDLGVYRRDDRYYRLDVVVTQAQLEWMVAKAMVAKGGQCAAAGGAIVVRAHPIAAPSPSAPAPARAETPAAEQQLTLDRGRRRS